MVSNLPRKFNNYCEIFRIKNGFKQQEQKQQDYRCMPCNLYRRIRHKIGIIGKKTENEDD
jgi:hypothetical protein